MTRYAVALPSSRVAARLGEALRGLLVRCELTPFRIALIYLVIGTALLYGFDFILPRYLAQPVLGTVQAIKGVVEVGVTAVLLFGLTYGSRLPLRARTRRLEREREELDVLHRVLRHNLRNDLNVIQGYATLLETTPTPAERDRWCQKIMTGVGELQGYTNKADQIRRIHTETNPTTEIDLTPVIERVIAGLDTTDAQITTDLPKSATVHANHMLETALRELITNAIQHNPSPTPHVRVRVDPDTGTGSSTLIEITDNGPGIPDTEVAVLEHAEENDLHHLSGLGLWLVYWTIQASHGTINITTTDTGTTVQIHLPNTTTRLPPTTA